MIKYSVGSPVTIKTWVIKWQKPETAQEKSLAPRIATVYINSFKHRYLIYFATVKYSSQVLEVSSSNSKEKFLKASVLFLKEKIPENGKKIILHLSLNDWRQPLIEASYLSCDYIRLWFYGVLVFNTLFFESG